MEIFICVWRIGNKSFEEREREREKEREGSGRTRVLRRRRWSGRGKMRGGTRARAKNKYNFMETAILSSQHYATLGKEIHIGPR